MTIFNGPEGFYSKMSGIRTGKCTEQPKIIAKLLTNATIGMEAVLLRWHSLHAKLGFSQQHT